MATENFWEARGRKLPGFFCCLNFPERFLSLISETDLGT